VIGLVVGAVLVAVVIWLPAALTGDFYEVTDLLIFAGLPMITIRVAVGALIGLPAAPVSGAGRARPGKAGQGRAGPGRAGQGRAGPGKAGQGRAGPGKAGQGRARPGRAGTTLLPDQQSCRRGRGRGGGGACDVVLPDGHRSGLALACSGFAPGPSTPTSSR